jgi:hypothetical protein
VEVSCNNRLWKYCCCSLPFSIPHDRDNSCHRSLLPMPASVHTHISNLRNSVSLCVSRERERERNELHQNGTDGSHSSSDLFTALCAEQTCADMKLTNGHGKGWSPSCKKEFLRSAITARESQYVWVLWVLGVWSHGCRWRCCQSD